MYDPAPLLHSFQSLATALAFLSGNLWSELGDVIARNQRDAQAVGLVVLVVVLWFALWRWRRNHRDFRVYRDEGGVATISRKALRHLIVLACEAVGTASRPSICFRQSRGSVDVCIAVKLYQEQRLGDVHERLRQRIRAAFEHTHGITMGEVNLKVTGFKKSRTEHFAAEDAALVTPAAAGYGAADTTSADDDSPASGLRETAPASELTPLAVDAPGEPSGGRRRWGLFGRRSEPTEATSDFVETGDEASAPSAEVPAASTESSAAPTESSAASESSSAR